MKFRGIDPVIATLILIIIAVVAGVAVYGLVTGLVAQTVTQQSPGSIVIDAASVDTNGNGTVVVRNVGIQDTEVVAVYILDATDLSLLGSDTGLSQSVSAGGTASFNYNTNASPSSGEWVIVKVVTRDGAVATYKVKVQ